MKNYQSSDYALNKHSEGIVYLFADKPTTVTLENYLKENPDKTEQDFKALKALSDEDYLESDRSEYRQTWKNTSMSGLEETVSCAIPSPEDEIIEQPHKNAEKNKKRELASGALKTLTEVQRRRYLLYHAHGLNERQIAEKEGSTQQAVSKSLYWAEKKIKKFLEGVKK